MEGRGQREAAGSAPRSPQYNLLFDSETPSLLGQNPSTGERGWGRSEDTRDPGRQEGAAGLRQCGIQKFRAPSSSCLALREPRLPDTFHSSPRSWPPPGPGLAALCVHSLVARSSPSHLQVSPCLPVSRRATGESLNPVKHQEPPKGIRRNRYLWYFCSRT